MTVSTPDLPPGAAGNPVSELAARLHAEGRSWRDVAQRLGIPPGRAFLVATGRPADGGHALTPAEHAAWGQSPQSTQDLINPPAQNPTVTRRVHDWVQRRAAAELTRPEAKG